MTLNTYISTYNGKTLGYPEGSYVGECLSLVKQYMKEVFGFNPPPSGSNSAYGYWSNFPKPLGDYFDKVANTDLGVPKRGDVVIWDTDAGAGFGHIAIFLEGDANRFTSLDQNWNGKQTHVQEHNYNNVVGWLTPKGQPMSDLLTYLGVSTDSEAKAKLNEHLGEVNGKCNWGMTGDKGGYLGSERKKNDQLTTENQSHETEISALQAENAQLRQDLEDCEATDPGTDPAGWVKNGLMKEELIDGIKWITNYERA